MLNQSEANWIHFDLINGVFVPNVLFACNLAC